MDNYQIYIPMDRRQALARGESLPDRAEGAALFADISGYTPLTEALVQRLGPRRGAEEVASQSNQVYDALIMEVERYGGSVISFAGDAITCWFATTGEPHSAALRAIACGLAMQAAMSQFAALTITGGQVVTLAMKVGVAAGPARRFLVGDPEIQLIDVLAGQTLAQMSAAEQVAERGEVIVDGSTAALLGEQLEVLAWRHAPESATSADSDSASFAVVAGLRAPVAPTPWPAFDPAHLTEAEVRPWLHAPVYERLRSGQGDFLAELRPAVALFARFGGLDYDQDEAAGEKLDSYIRWVQQVVARYEGYLLQVTIGDKGSFFYIAFGAPIAHGDDAQRAVATALALREVWPGAQAGLGADVAIGPTQIGLSRGMMRTGGYGSKTRRTYGVLGDEVNLAARLMGKAQPGQILLSPRLAESVGRSFQLQLLPPITVKGKREPIAVSAVLGQRIPSPQRPATIYTHPLVGREAELAQIQQVLTTAIAGQGQILRLEGVAGVGKSHLTAEMVERALGQGMRVVLGACQSTTQGSAYLPWRQALRALLGLDEEQSAEASQANVLAALKPEWAVRVPLLGELLGLAIPDNATTASLEPRLRQQALWSLVVEFLQEAARQQPLLLVIEDAHWADEASLGLTLALGRALGSPADEPAGRIVLALVQRPPLDAGQPLLPDLTRLPYHHFLNLSQLNPQGVAALVAQRLGGPVVRLVLDLMEVRAQGNPFFIEEVLAALRESDAIEQQLDGSWTAAPSLIERLQAANALVRQEDEWQLAPDSQLSGADLGLPDSIQGIVLSRIDRLPEAHQLTLKVASVIGRTFALEVLAHAHPLQPSQDALLAEIGLLEDHDFAFVELPAPWLIYLFKHNITQEVAYNTLLFKQRSRLHGAVAFWYEQRFGGTLAAQPPSELPIDETLTAALAVPFAAHYALLAYHWHQAEEPLRERHYAWLAGQQAMAQYANEDAVTYFSRALTLSADDDLHNRARLLLAREAVENVRGNRAAQSQDLTILAELAETLEDDRLRAEVAVRRAGYGISTGDYGGALEAAEKASEYARRAGKLDLEGRSYLLQGRAFAQQGNYESARPFLEQALQLFQTTKRVDNEAECLNELGDLYFFQNELSLAKSYYEQALTICRLSGYKQNEAASFILLGRLHGSFGDYQETREYFEQALEIYRTIGYRWGEALTLANLNTNLLDIGDYVAGIQTQHRAIQICREIGYRRAEAIGLDTLGMLQLGTGLPAAAFLTINQALEVQRELGDRHSIGYSLTHLGQVLLDLSDLPAAKEAYNEALSLRHELGEQSLAIDDLAGLAIVALGQGDMILANRYAEQVLVWLEEQGTEGIEYPLRVYLACYKVFRARAESDPALLQRAQAILEQAYTLLQEQAARIRDEGLRHTFLENIPAHREIRASWEASKA